MQGFNAYELTAIRKALGVAELNDNGSGPADFLQDTLARASNAYMDFLAAGDKAIAGTDKIFFQLSPQTQKWIKENE